LNSGNNDSKDDAGFGSSEEQISAPFMLAAHAWASELRRVVDNDSDGVTFKCFGKKRRMS
jgi:hypothetical protein